MDKLFELVSDRPLRQKDVKKTKCPYCGSKEIQSFGTMGTLVGGDPDPNHYWNDCQCKKCHKRFIKEYKRDNVWYTGGLHLGYAKNKDGKLEPIDDKLAEQETGKLLRGVPSCFERYIYSCGKCGAKHSVHREYREVDGTTPHTSGVLKYTIGSDKQHQRCFYVCKECGEEIEYEQENWHSFRKVPKSKVKTSETRWKLNAKWNPELCSFHSKDAEDKLIKELKSYYSKDDIKQIDAKRKTNEK